MFAGRRNHEAHVPVIEMSVNNKVTKLHHAVIPPYQQAVDEYRQNGGQLTDPDGRCVDPLIENQGKINIREHSFSQRFPHLDSIFHTLVNQDPRLFREATKFYIDVTYRLQNSL